jgi:hypothetical protein
MEGLDTLVFQEAILPELEGVVDQTVADWARGLLVRCREIAQALDLADLQLTTDGDDVSLQMGIEFKRDSVFTNLNWSEGANAMQVLSLVPNHHPVAAAVSMKLSSVMQRIVMLMRHFPPDKGLSQKDLAQGLGMLQVTAKATEKMGRDVSLSVGAPKSAIELAQFSMASPSDRELLAESQAAIKDPVHLESGVSLHHEEATQVDDVFLQPFTVKMDWEKLLSNVMDAPEMIKQVVKRRVVKIIGGEALHGAFACKAQTLGFFLGSNLTPQALSAMMSPHVDAEGHVAYALKHSGERPGFVLSMDLREVARQVTSVMDNFGIGNSDKKIDAGPLAPIVAYAGASGSRVTLGVRGIFSEIAPIVRILMRGAQR